MIDVGFGDALEPGIAETEYPVLLELPAPRLRTYPRKTVVAEKFEALVKLGRANTRIKDFYDMWLLSLEYKFEGDALARAIAATFTRRKTEIPERASLCVDIRFRRRSRQEAAFAEAIDAELSPLDQVLEELAMFLMPHATAAKRR